MKKIPQIVIVSIVLSLLSTFQAESESEEKGRIVTDTMYAQILVGESELHPGKYYSSAFDLIVKYHFETYPGSLTNIKIQVLGEEVVHGVCQTKYGSLPVDVEETDSIRTYFTLEYTGEDTVPVIISLYGSFYDSIEGGDHGTMSYVDTLMVPIK
jgi:hypothetical protein